MQTHPSSTRAGPLQFSASLKILRFTALLCVAAAVARAGPTSQVSSSGGTAGRNLPPHVICQADIHYGETAGKANLLDIYLPDKIDHPLPLIVWIHGGGWAAGDKSGCPALPAVSQGFAVASINYRLSSQAVYPAQIYDCKGAIRFLRAHADRYHIDPDHIGVWGASAGGHLVALLGTTAGSKELEGTVGGNLDRSSRVQAVCDWFGPTDLSQFADQAQASGIINTSPGPALIMALFGGTLVDKKDLVELANPISFISRKTAGDIPPFLIMHGDKDRLVPLAQSRMLNDALMKKGASVDFRIIPGAGHGIGFATPAIASTVRDFFAKNLK